MPSPSKRVLELTLIKALLEGNTCDHYNYDKILKHINMKLTPNPQNLSFQEEQTLENLLLEEFLEVLLTSLYCKGCNCAHLIINVLRCRKSLTSFVSTLCRTLYAGEFKSAFID